MAALVIIVGGVGSQPALGAGLTAVPSFVKSFDFELNLSFIDRDTLWLNGEILLVVRCMSLILVLDRGSVPVDAEPLTEVPTFCQGCSPGMGSARQPDQPGWRARPVTTQKLHIRRVR